MKAVNLPVLDNIKIASPCSVAWEDMPGNDRTRHCEQCNFNVFNLSNMTRLEAESLILSAQGRLCVRYYQRADGTILTKDCPVGLAAARAALARTATRVASIAAALCAAVVLGRSRNLSEDGRDLTSYKPFSTLATLLNRPPPPPMRAIMGDVCIPTPPKPVTSSTPSSK